MNKYISVFIWLIQADFLEEEKKKGTHPSNLLLQIRKTIFQFEMAFFFFSLHHSYKDFGDLRAKF